MSIGSVAFNVTYTSDMKIVSANITFNVRNYIQKLQAYACAG